MSEFVRGERGGVSERVLVGGRIFLRWEMERNGKRNGKRWYGMLCM